jgi:hypothetical protein
MNRKLSSVRLLLPVLLLLATAAFADVVLVEDGRARAKIFVAPGVMEADRPGAKHLISEAEKQRERLRDSVKDLALYLEKISGAHIEIVTTPPVKENGIAQVVVGELASKAFGPPAKTAPFKQGFRMVVAPGAVGLLGESDLATSYAIYELLDRLGCRWYMPGEWGEVIQKTKTIALPETDFSSAPGTIYRGIWYADDDYKRRNRHGGLMLHAGHALEGYISDAQRAEHPEWVAEVHGKPHKRRLKWSNPGVASAIADYWIERLQKNPVDSISLSPDDGIDFDESKEDKAIDANDFDTTSQTVSLTDRQLVISNRVAERVCAKYPDVLFGMLAYGPSTRPPVREKVHPNIVPQIAPITYSRSHPMTMDEVPDNKELRALIEGWGKAAKMTSVYFYAWFLAEPSAPNPMIKKWSVDVPFVLKNNCQFWQPETTANFETSMHALYLGCRLAWNPALKPADIIAELNTGFYGHAAKEMTAYWDFIDDVWVGTPDYSGCGFGYMFRWTPERLVRARQLLNEGLAACTNPLEIQRVKIADESLELFELFMKLRRDQAEGRWATVAAEADQWRKRISYLGTKYKDQSAFTLMRWSPHTLSGSYFAQFYQQSYDEESRVAKEYTLLTKQPLREFRYQADADKSGEAKGWASPTFDDSSWKTTDVCVDTWSTLGYHAWFKSMWYRTTLKLPPGPKDKKIFLMLTSTDGSAKVFINGKPIDYSDTHPRKGVRTEFDGYCQPVSFDITDAVKLNQTCQVSILCTRTFFNELGTGGLLGPAMIYREK